MANSNIRTTSVDLKILKLWHFDLDKKTLGDPIDLKYVFNKIMIFGELNSNPTHGEIVINEQGNLIKDLPITGSEIIEIQFNSLNNSSAYDDFHRLFFVYAVTNLQDSGNMKEYILHFDDVISMINVDMRISRLFDMKYEDFIKEMKTIIENDDDDEKNNKLYKEILSKTEAKYKNTTDLFELYTESNYTIEKTDAKLHFVPPNLSPLSTIDLFTKYAVSTESFGMGEYRFSDLCFYQNRKGQFVTTSILNMYSTRMKSKDNQNVTFKKVIGNTQSENNKGDVFEPYEIRNNTIEDKFHITNLKMSGFLGYIDFGFDFYNNMFKTGGNEYKKKDFVDNIVKPYLSMKSIGVVTDSYVKPIRENYEACHMFFAHGIQPNNQNFETPNMFYEWFERPYNISVFARRYLFYKKISLQMCGIPDMDVGKYVNIDMGSELEDIKTFGADIENSRWIVSAYSHTLKAEDLTLETNVELMAPYTYTSSSKES